MSATKYFKDNLARLNATANPIEWNQNQGLLAMAKQLDQAESQREELLRHLKRLEAAVQDLSRR